MKLLSRRSDVNKKRVELARTLTRLVAAPVSVVLLCVRQKVSRRGRGDKKSTQIEEQGKFLSTNIRQLDDTST